MTFPLTKSISESPQYDKQLTISHENQSKNIDCREFTPSTFNKCLQSSKQLVGLQKELLITAEVIDERGDKSFRQLLIPKKELIAWNNLPDDEVVSTTNFKQLCSEKNIFLSLINDKPVLVVGKYNSYNDLGDVFLYYNLFEIN